MPLRRRWRFICWKAAQAAAELLANGTPANQITRHAVAEIAGPRMGWLYGGPYGKMSDKAAIRKFERYLENAEISHALRKWLAEKVGLSIVDFGTKLKEHVLSDDPDVSLRGMALYKSVALPPVTKNVNVKQETLVARISVRDAPPETAVLPIDVTPILPAGETIEHG